MKIAFEPDRIRWQSQNRKESQALLAVHDLVFFKQGINEDIANDFGCTGDLNYCCTPLPMTPDEGDAACIAFNATN